MMVVSEALVASVMWRMNFRAGHYLPEFCLELIDCGRLFIDFNSLRNHKILV